MDSDSGDRSASSSPKERGDEAHPLEAARNLAQYAALAGGFILLLLGWYGISGTADLAGQVPYLASATIPGASLVVAGAILIANDRSRRSQERAAEQIATLYRLLTVAVDTPSASGVTTAPGPVVDTDAAVRREGVVAVEGAKKFHRPQCALVAGKDNVVSVTTAVAEQRHLEPCPICDPPRPTT